MEKLSTKKIIDYDFSKQKRGKLLAEITNQALKSLGKNYKMPRGYKTEFIEFSKDTSINTFGDTKSKKIYFSFDILLDKENFAKDVYTVTKEIRRLCEFKGTYDENNPIDKVSSIFTSTEDLSKMITIEKSGNAGKEINSINQENSSVINQIEKDVEFFMLGKNFLSPREKQSRKFALDYLKKMLQSLSVESASNIQSIMDNLEKFIKEKEEEEQEKETCFTNFIQNVERNIIATVQLSEERLSDEIVAFAGMDSQVKNYKNAYGYDPIKCSAQALAISYNPKLAKNLFNACVSMDKDIPKYLNTCLDLIKYTNFTPTQNQIHSLNQACKNYNATCQDNKDKIHPKKDLKNFYNVKTSKQSKEATNAYAQTDVNIN